MSIYLENQAKGLYLVSQEFLNDLLVIKQDVTFIKHKLNENPSSHNLDLIPAKVGRQEIGVCAKTWNSYLKSGKLPYIQYGSKIWVKRADLNKFLDSNYIKD